MPFPGKKHKSKEEQHYNRFCEWMKPLFLQIPLTDAIKMPPYSKCMKDIVTNKRKIASEEISTLLANYSFDGKVPEKLGDPGIPTIPCSIKNNYVRTALCDLGVGVSVMPFSLYKRLDLEKLYQLIYLCKWMISLLLFLLVYVRIFLFKLLIIV
jgi:hypothetical protein